MKKLFITLLLAITYTGFSQNLESKIPKNATAIVSVNGDAIFDLISMTEINNINFIKDGLKSANKNSIADFGFDLKKKAYYFFQTVDGKQFHNMLISLTDKSKFEELLGKNELSKIIQKNGYSTIFDGKSATAWNDNLLVLTISQSSYNDDSAYNEYDIIYEEVDDLEMTEPESDVEEIEEIFEMTEPEMEVVEDTPQDARKHEIKETTSDVPQEAKKKESNGIIETQLLNILNTSLKNSIVTNKNYQKSKNKKAAAHAWVSSYNNLFIDLMNKETSAIGFKLNKGDDFIGMEEMNSYLFFNKNDVKLSTNIKISDKFLDTYKAIYNSKLDKNFLKYIDANNTLAYFSMSMDTESMLREYPKLMTQIYGNMLPKFKEETAIGLEFMEVLLDEKAIGELITGDIMFVLNDIAEREITYTSYTYDDDYNSTEVTKTKKELMPDFTVMLGSKNKSLITKLMKLSLKHRLSEANGDVFKLNKQITRAPFDMFYTIKDGIVFLTNSEKQANSISNNTFKSNLGKHKKLLKKNILVGYADVKQLLTKVPSNLISPKQEEFLSYMQNNVTEVYTTASKVKKGKFYTDQIIKTSGKDGNSLRFIIKTVERFIHLTY